MFNVKRNLTMLTDFYELTMSAGYFNEGYTEKISVFDMFFRRVPDGGGYAIMAGLEQFIQAVDNLHFTDEDITYLRDTGLFSEQFLDYLKNFEFHCNVWAIEEGMPIFPSEPIVTVEGPAIECQLIETLMLVTFNHQCLIATKGNRIVRSAEGRPVMEFGARRAQGYDGAYYGARAAYISGCSSTSCVMAGRDFGIPVSGTMAHAWVQMFPTQYDAFKKYAELYPDNCILLVDTFNVLKSGIPDAIKVFEEVLKPLGKRPKGIRIDSGDIAYLSKKARKMLDEAGYPDCTICASNSLDEYTITSILDQGGAISSFGVGERMITAKSDPVFGAVYKLCAVTNDAGVFEPRIKISETVEKITNPGLKRVYRVYNAEGKAFADLIAGQEGVTAEDVKNGIVVIDPERPWKKRLFRDCGLRELQTKVLEGGRRTGPAPTVREIAKYVRKQLNEEIWEEEQRFRNPHKHYIDMTSEYYNMKMDMLEEKTHG